MWFVSRRRYTAEVSSLRSQYDALRERCEIAEKNTATERVAGRTSARLFDQADEERTALTHVNARLTEDLAEERRVSESLARQIHTMAQPLEPDPDAIDWPAKYEAEQERADRLQAQLDDARLLASRLTAAAETRQQLDDQERPVDAAPPAHKEGPSARLRRERDRVRKLEQRLSDMQLTHVADTRELHDLRQGVQK